MRSAEADGRVERGNRTRGLVLRRTVDIASVEGLEALSVGRLATELGLSKSGVFALFGSKEELQLATVRAASRIFADEVLEPVDGIPAGVTRLARLCESNQHDDGGWNFSKAEGDPDALAAPGDIDMTGAAMAALCVSGVPKTDPAVAKAKNFLKSKLINNSGALDAMFGANTDSNGWAVSGLNACGINPQTGDFLTRAGKTPVDFLIAQQFKPGGGFKYLPTDTTPSAYASIDGLRAVAGGGFATAPPTPATAGTPRWARSSTRRRPPPSRPTASPR